MRRNPNLLLSTLRVAALLSLASIAAAAGEVVPFIGQVSLPDGRIVVVAEPRLEPRSLGSYSLRLYSGTNPGFPFDDFITGAIFVREGTISDISLADVDDDGVAEVVVVCRSVGSGSYLDARAFSLEGDTISVVAEVAGLPPGQDPLVELRR